MVITEAIPNVRTPMWSTNDHGLQDTPCFAFRGWTWNHDFHWFPVFPSSTSNETMNSPTLSEKKKTLMNHSLTGLLRDKWQAPRRDLPVTVCLTLFLAVPSCRTDSSPLSSKWTYVFQCFSSFFSIAWGFEPQETRLLFCMGAFNLGSGLHGNSWPSGLSGDRAPDFHPKWHRMTMALSEGVKQNKPTTISPWLFSNQTGWMKNYQNVKETVKHHQPPSNTNKHQ